MKNFLGFVFWCGLSFSAGWFGSQFKPGKWYDTLIKPSWTPPSILFPIAWSILYTLMGTAAWLVWKKSEEHQEVFFALGIFIIQLLLNAIWSWIFFGRHQIGLAFAEIILLWGVIAYNTTIFWRINPTAGLVMIPYGAWVLFAVGLNGAIWMKN